MLARLDRTDLGFNTTSSTEERFVIPSTIEKVNTFEMVPYDFVNNTTFRIDEVDASPPAP